MPADDMNRHMFPEGKLASCVNGLKKFLNSEPMILHLAVYYKGDQRSQQDS